MSSQQKMILSCLRKHRCSTTYSMHCHQNIHHVFIKAAGCGHMVPFDAVIHKTCVDEVNRVLLCSSNIEETKTQWEAIGASETTKLIGRAQSFKTESDLQNKDDRSLGSDNEIYNDFIGTSGKIKDTEMLNVQPNILTKYSPHTTYFEKDIYPVPVSGGECIKSQQRPKRKLKAKKKKSTKKGTKTGKKRKSGSAEKSKGPKPKIKTAKTSSKLVFKVTPSSTRSRSKSPITQIMLDTKGGTNTPKKISSKSIRSKISNRHTDTKLTPKDITASRSRSKSPMSQMMADRKSRTNTPKKASSKSIHSRTRSKKIIGDLQSSTVVRYGEECNKEGVTADWQTNAELAQDEISTDEEDKTDEYIVRKTKCLPNRFKNCRSKILSCLLKMCKIKR